MTDAQSPTPREIAERVGWEHTKGPGWRFAHVDDIEKAIKYAIGRDRAAGPVTVTDEMVERAARAFLKAASTYLNDDDLDHMVSEWRKKPAFWPHVESAFKGARAAVAAVGHIPAPSPDLLARVVEGCAKICEDPGKRLGDADSHWGPEYARRIRTRASQIIADAQSAPESDT